MKLSYILNIAGGLGLLIGMQVNACPVVTVNPEKGDMKAHGHLVVSIGGSLQKVIDESSFPESIDLRAMFSDRTCAGGFNFVDPIEVTVKQEKYTLHFPVALAADISQVFDIKDRIKHEKSLSELNVSTIHIDTLPFYLDFKSAMKAWSEYRETLKSKGFHKITVKGVTPSEQVERKLEAKYAYYSLPQTVSFETWENQNVGVEVMIVRSNASVNQGPIFARYNFVILVEDIPQQSVGWVPSTEEENIKIYKEWEKTEGKAIFKNFDRSK